MVRDLAHGPVAAHALERAGDVEVHATLRCRGQVVYHRALDEAVGEAMLPATRLGDEPGAHGRIERFEHSARFGLHSLGHHVGGELRADDRRHLQQPPGAVGEPAEPRVDHLAHPLRAGDLVEGPGDPPATGAAGQVARVDELAPQLTEQEGVAARLGVEHVDDGVERRVGLLAGGAGHEASDPVAVEPGQGDPADTGVPAEVG